MKKILVPFADTHQFSSLIDDYLSGEKSLQPFYDLPPELKSFEQAITRRKNMPCDRHVLYSRLVHQYGTLLNNQEESSQKVSGAISLLKNENCFTVTTGHQLNIFTGPLFSIYKIITTIKLANELSRSYPEYQFVPVFWMASEDHDFEEISQFNIFGKPITWNRNPGGAVGRMNLEEIQQVIENVKQLLGEDALGVEIFESAYMHSATLAEATRKIMHALFGALGLVVIDGDDTDLKRLFIPEMHEDLVTNKSFVAVTETSKQLSEIHKILVQPRPINLFYLGEGSRERIVKSENGNYEVLNTNLVFTVDELIAELNVRPDKFSPNVLLRPMYQEKILPNLAYIGGPGELQYWLQFKEAFITNNISFPILILRNCILFVDKSSSAKLEKLGLTVPDLFKSTDTLILKVLENSAEIHVGTAEINSLIQKIYSELSNEWERLDASLVASVESEKQKALKGLSGLEEKARRAMKKKNESVVNQVKNLKEKLFPSGGLQERNENFLSFYSKSELNFIKDIIKLSDPFEKQFVVFIED